MSVLPVLAYRLIREDKFRGEEGLPESMDFRESAKKVSSNSSSLLYENADFLIVELLKISPIYPFQ